MINQGAGTIASYSANVALLNAYQRQQANEFQRLGQIESAELSKIDQMVSKIKQEADNYGHGIENTRNALAEAGVNVGFTATCPPQFDPAATPNQILELLIPISQSVHRHAAELPRLHLRHQGMRRDRIILPVFAAGWLLCMSMVLNGGFWAGVFVTLAGAAAASLFVRVSGGGWTFRRLGGQDFTPRRPGQVAGTGALAAFLVFGGLMSLFWGVATFPDGLLPGIIVGAAMLAMPIFRSKDVLKLNEQVPR